MDERLGKARAIALVFLGVALIAAGPWVGFWTILVLLGLAVAWAAIRRITPHMKQPEWPIFAGWFLSSAAIAVSIVLTGGAQSPAKSWLLIPAATLPARFSGRGLKLGIAITFAFLILSTIVADPAEIADEPQLFIFPAALIAATLSLSMALRSAEIYHRAESVIDQLTGMLNRKALEARAAELEQQSHITGQPVGLVLCDIDHFKAVNDTHGHGVGDAVLRDVAYRIRKELRAYDLAYRLGGEEFVVLVPGASLDSTRKLAERLRVAIVEERVADVPVSASFGVAAVGEGETLAFQKVLGEADEALYRAKAAGRNRVCGPDDLAFAALAD